MLTGKFSFMFNVISFMTYIKAILISFLGEHKERTIYFTEIYKENTVVSA